MEGVAIQSNAVRNSQLLASSSKIVSDIKGVHGPRKVLAELQNVQAGKAVSFDKSKLSFYEPTITKKTLQVNRNVNTPGSRTSKLKTPRLKSGIRPKAAGTSIKIYVDNSEPVSNVSNVKSKYDTPDCKEYMAPCTDREFHIPLPDYVEKACRLKPTLNIDYFLRENSIPPLEEIKENADELSADDISLPMFSDLSLMDDVLIDIDHELLLQMESDASFSLDRLDENIRSAGLDVPEW